MTNNLGLINGGDINFAYSKGGGTDVGASMALMKYQDNIWRDSTEWYNKNGYSFLRQGLINADLNPLLAIYKDPLSAPEPNASATQPTSSFNYDGAASANAQTARKMSDSQIQLNKASAYKTSQEGISEADRRDLLRSQTFLATMQGITENRLLPYKERQFAADIINKYADAELKRMTAAYVPVNAKASMISANAADYNARNKGYTTSVNLPFGLGSYSHTGAPNQYTRMNTGQYEFIPTTEYIGGKPVTVMKMVPINKKKGK